MRHFLTILFFILAGAISSGAHGAQVVKPYKEWKADKVQQIQLRVLQTKVQIENLKTLKQQESKSMVAGFKPVKSAAYASLQQRYEKELTEEKWNLEVAQDLSLTDYIVLYLASFPSKTRFLDAAAQLNPTEVAELMEAYSETLGAPTPASLAVGTAAASTSIRVPREGLLPAR